MGAFLAAWPWENFGNLKYILYAPLVAQVVYSFAYEEEDYTKALWCLNILIICGLKGLVHILWSCYSNLLFLIRPLRINPNGVDYKQIDHEWHWDNYILVQAIIASVICYMSPTSMMNSLPLWNTKGLLALIVLHVTFSEPLYYFLHRSLHRNNYFFTHYHSFHHSSPVPHPMTAENSTFLESLILCVVTGVPLIGSCLLGVGSLSLIYGYAIMFDFLRCLGYCNVEIFSHKLFEALPVLRYLIYTPTYHSLHHQEMGTNFCLFMPLFDYFGNTLNPNSWQLQRKIRLDAATEEHKRVPEFVFLAHGVDIMSCMHAPFVFRSFASMAYTTRLFLLPMWPFTLMVTLGMWVWSKAFLFSFYTLKTKLCQTWAVPRFGYQYFLPFATKGINNQIENAILRADKIGVKVISLAALNKNEALNGGGTLFVNKHPDLRVRVVHGNTLTAAVILNEIPKDVTEVFLTGATSKLGRAIALYLCRRGIRVLMLTLSLERFQKIQKEAPVEFQNYLVQVTKYNAAQHCKTWIVGKWLTPREQSWAPAGTHFHQFVVPPILSFRRNCTYGDLAAMRLPKDVQGLGTCEYTMDRGVVHACHAGGVVHMLEGWKHHEVGAIDVDRIDLVWGAAMKHGFSSVASLTN